MMNDDRLRRLADKDEIRDVIMRYSRGVDRADEEIVRSCYHADSHDDHGHFKGTGHDFAAFIVESLPSRTHHSTHATTNCLIEIDPDDPDVARAESTTLAYLRRTADDGAEWLDMFAGRYVDRFERRDGVWRIARRTVVHDWSTSTRLADDAFPLPMDTFVQGTRGRSDIIYDV